MRFARGCLFALCFTLLAAVAPRLGPGPRTVPRRVPLQASTPSNSTQPETPQRIQQAYSLPPDKLSKAITLGRISTVLDIGGSLWGLAVLWLLLATRWAAAMAAWTERRLSRRWMQGLLFFAILFVITTLANLPLDAVGHAVRRYYGISVQGWAGWFGDVAKSLGLLAFFGSPILLFFNWIASVSPRRYWMWIWMVSLPLIVSSTFAAPMLDHVFNKFEPLIQNHSALVGKLETVVARTGTKIAPNRMFLMKASAKSTGLNAYVTGIGATKRFVLWDTAIDRLPDDEVLFIFGHESGHYVLNHIPKVLCGSAIGLFFVLWGSAGFASWLVRRFGARWHLGGIELGQNALASRQGFLVLLFALSVASFVVQPIGNTFSRYFEHQADVYGQEAIHGLVTDPQKTAVSSFNHLGEAWLEDPNPSPFIEFWEYSHPSVQTRANFAAHYDPWANGGHGRFFDK
ncbi:MAG: M48 family metallopeptidase [Terracidiphilus sp.]|jgi:Zn-dependent protease with chaperone function